MNRSVTSLGATIALLLGSATADAEELDGYPATTDPRAAHAATDRNSDGYIDREEFHHRMVEVFYFADGNRSGDCDRGELMVWDEEALFARADHDGDGRISMYEFVNGRFEDFESADTDNDGRLTVEEVIAEFEG